MADVQSLRSANEALSIDIEASIKNAFAQDTLIISPTDLNKNFPLIMKQIQPTPSMAQLLVNEDLDNDMKQVRQNSGDNINRQYIQPNLRNDSQLQRDRYFNTINSRRNQSQDQSYVKGGVFTNRRHTNRWEQPSETNMESFRSQSGLNSEAERSLAFVDSQ